MQVYWNIHVKYVLNPILLFKKCMHTFSKGTVNEATQLFHIHEQYIYIMTFKDYAVFSAEKGTFENAYSILQFVKYINAIKSYFKCIVYIRLYISEQKH